MAQVGVSIYLINPSPDRQIPSLPGPAINPSAEGSQLFKKPNLVLGLEKTGHLLPAGVSGSQSLSGGTATAPAPFLVTEQGWRAGPTQSSWGLSLAV